MFISLPNPSEETLKKLESDLFQFLWNKKPDKVARKQVIQTYLDGGINMLHVKSFLKSMKISWMKRLLSCNSTWTKVLEHILKIKKDFFFTLGPELSKMVAKNTANAFWKDTLNCYSEFKEICRKNDTNEELIYHEVWYNIDIKVDRKCIFYKIWYDKGLRYIRDFLNDDGSFLNYETFCEKFNFNPTDT